MTKETRELIENFDWLLWGFAKKRIYSVAIKTGADCKSDVLLKDILLALSKWGTIFNTPWGTIFVDDCGTVYRPPWDKVNANVPARWQLLLDGEFFEPCKIDERGDEPSRQIIKYFNKCLDSIEDDDDDDDDEEDFGEEDFDDDD